MYGTALRHGDNAKFSDFVVEKPLRALGAGEERYDLPTEVLPVEMRRDGAKARLCVWNKTTGDHFLSAGTKGAGKAAADAGNAATNVADHEKEVSTDDPSVEPTRHNPLLGAGEGGAEGVNAQLPGDVGSIQGRGG